jgi:4-aminobutyrate aminotransferase/(S)-3-amino-2-methylpropionate transaminase
MTTNLALLARRQAALPRGLATAHPIFADRAEGGELWDVEGRRYIDFASGIAVLNTGHGHPRIVAAVREQLDRFIHTAAQVVGYEAYISLCERLNALAPVSGPAKTVLFTTGAEAVENAVKIARVATGRSAVIAFAGGFHGRTHMTMGLTGKVSPYKRGFGPGPASVYHLPFPTSDATVAVSDSLRALQQVFAADVEPEAVAAIIVEPVQGEGGFRPAPPELLQALREICDQHCILLIADEVQTGFARTGRMFAIEHSGVAPDLITVAKSLAGGLPLSGVIGRADLMDRVDPGGLGGTYGGAPLACVAALAVLDVIEDEGLCKRAETLGAHLQARLETLALRNASPIRRVRRLGAMVAFDLVGQDEAADPLATRRLLDNATERGLILLSCGPDGATVRLIAPLTAPTELVDEGMDRLAEALSVVSQ